MFTYSLNRLTPCFLFTVLAFLINTLPARGQCTTYTTTGLYSFTVPQGGLFRVEITAKGADGGTEFKGKGGSGATVTGTFVLQTGDVITSIVGQSGASGSDRTSGGGGTGVVLTRNNVPSLLLAAGGGGGAAASITVDGGGGQGRGPSTGGTGGVSNGSNGGGGGGGGLDGPGQKGTNGAKNNLYSGTGGGQASLTALSPGGADNSNTNRGGQGFGGGGGGDLYRSGSGGGGGYGGGNVGFEYFSATGGYSYLSSTASNTAITPGLNGGGQNQDGQVTITLPPSPIIATAPASKTTICSGQTVTLAGSLAKATGTWTMILSDGTSTTGNTSSFSIPLTPTTSTTYTIQCLYDGNGAALSTNLQGSLEVTVNTSPTLFSVTGLGGYCPGSAGAAIGLDGSDPNITYYLLLTGSRSPSPADERLGTGNPLSFTPQTQVGTYTVQALNKRNQCQPVMNGSVTVSLLPSPTSFSVTGGGAFCQGGTGAPIGLADSETGVTYTLLRNGSPTSATLSGTGNALSFGSQTLTGTYTVQAATTQGQCLQTMSGSVTVSITSLPNASFSGLASTYCNNASAVTLVPTTAGGSFSGPGISGTSFNPATASTGGTIAYSLTVNGCSNTSSQTVTVNAAPTLSAGASLPQANVGVTVSLSATGASAYQWTAPTTASFTTPSNTSATSASLTTAGVQTFTVVGTTGACSQSAIVSLTALAGPDLSPLINMPSGNFAPGETKGMLIQLQEVNGGNATGNLLITITVPTGYSISFDNTLTSLNVSGGSSVNVQNPKWQISNTVASQQLSLRLNGGESVGPRSTMNIGVFVSRTSANGGSYSNITISVADDSGGTYDVNRLNNIYARIINGI